MEEGVDHGAQPPAVSCEGSLVHALRNAIEDSLTTCMHTNAIFYAERLYECQPTYRHLHILAHCYSRGGGAATACRLLQGHYPFFEPTSSTWTNPLWERARRTAVGPSSSSSPSAFRQGDGGKPLLPRETPDLAARWDCQYLFGVCCAQTGRYREGMDALQRLLSLAWRLEAEGAGSEGNEEEDDDEEEEEEEEEGTDSATERNREIEVILRLARRQARMQQLKHLGSCTAGCPRYYRQREGEVKYWIEMCARRQHLDKGPELRDSAFTANPLLFAAFECYVQAAKRPLKEDCLAVYSSPASFASATATAAAASTSLVSAAVRRDNVEKEAKALRERDRLRRFLVPYARATFLVHASRCREAQTALDPRNFPRCGHAEHHHHHHHHHGGTTGDNANGPLVVASPWRLSLYALSCFHWGDMKGSAAAFQELLAACPWRLNDPALMYYSTALWQLKADGELGALAQRLIEEMPMSPITLVVVANAYSLAKEPKDAIAMLDRAIQMDGSVAYAHALRGYELLSMGMTKEAWDSFSKAVNTDSNMYTAYAGLGELSMREERVETARQYFQQAIAINPQPTIMNRYAATFHQRLAPPRHDLFTALTIYSKAVQSNPANVSARHQRAHVLLSLGRAKDAMAEVQEMIQSYPEEAMLHVTLARCQEAQGLLRQAILSYHTAMTLDPRQEGFIRGCIEKLSEAAGREGGGGGGDAGNAR